MKSAACLLAVLLLCPALRGSDISDLAAGYANAFQALGKSCATVTYSDSGQPVAIKNVKDVRAFGGALLLRLNTGDQLILSSGSVLRISE